MLWEGHDSHLYQTRTTCPTPMLSFMRYRGLEYCPIKFAPGYCEKYSDRNILYSKGTIGLADGEHCIFMDTGTVRLPEID